MVRSSNFDLHDILGSVLWVERCSIVWFLGGLVLLFLDSVSSEPQAIIIVCSVVLLELLIELPQCCWWFSCNVLHEGTMAEPLNCYMLGQLF